MLLSGWCAVFIRPVPCLTLCNNNTIRSFHCGRPQSIRQLWKDNSLKETNLKNWWYSAKYCWPDWLAWEMVESWHETKHLLCRLDETYGRGIQHKPLRWDTNSQEFAWKHSPHLNMRSPHLNMRSPHLQGWRQTQPKVIVLLAVRWCERQVDDYAS